jgi:hypothetical protein
MIWEASNPQALRWRNEMSITDGPWTLIEEYDMLPDGVA